MSVAALVGLIAGGITHVVLPDNSDEPDAVQKLVADAVQAAVTRNLAGALPMLLANGLAVVKAQSPVLPAPAAAPPVVAAPVAPLTPAAA